MSHVVAVAVVISNLAALKAACTKLNLVFHEGQKTHKWYGAWQNDYSAEQAAYKQGIPVTQYGHCEHAIGVPGAKYEIGVYRNPNGPGYILAFDSWGRDNGQPIVKALGPSLEKLKQGYAVAMAMATAKAKGWMVATQQLPNGTVKLILSGVN